MKKMDVFNGSKYSDIVRGLYYEDDFITEEEESDLLDTIYSMNWTDIIKRRVQHYGHKYDYSSKKIEIAEELPKVLMPITKKISEYLLEEKGQLFNQIIINEYLSGQGIAAHTDLYQLGDIVACVSLGSTVVMDFTNITGESYPVQLNRRSLLVMRGDSRYIWKHGISSRKSDILLQPNGSESRVKRTTRVSITFRLVPD